MALMGRRLMGSWKFILMTLHTPSFVLEEKLRAARKTTVKK